MTVLEQILNYKKQGKKALAILIDPDNVDESTCLAIIQKANMHAVAFFFVGGSLIVGNQLERVIHLIKTHSNIPTILFPGNSLHITASAHAILFLSLVSGRNPDLLIGQHVLAAPILKKTALEVIPTGYMLIDGGKQTTVSYMSNTTPIPHNKPDIAICTAMASELLGLKLIYMDAGSGAQNAINPKMIGSVKAAIEVPLIIGGGIDSAQKAHTAWEAGADIVVVGNAIERNPNFIDELYKK